MEYIPNKLSLVLTLSLASLSQWVWRRARYEEGGWPATDAKRMHG